MLEKNATVITTDASRYLKRLCKHFNHKVEAEWDDHRGLVHFPMGDCHMAATDGALDIRCRAEGVEALDQMGEIVSSHLERFAHKDDLTVVWAQG